jgi:hypothetical protein
MMAKAPTADGLIKTVKEAVGDAGEKGILVFNVGHGSVTDSGEDGWVDLSPNGSFKLGSRNIDESTVYVKVFYDEERPKPYKSDKKNDEDNNPNSDRLKRWAKYNELAEIIKKAKLGKVIFLTCRVGKATDFLTKIATDFGTDVEAYKFKVQLTPQSHKPPVGNDRMRIHLQSDTDGNNTNIPENEENLMIGIKPSDVVVVKPKP